MRSEPGGTRLGGRAATSAVIPGRFALSVGKPNLPTPKGWRWTLLTDVARLETGHTPSRKRPEYWNGDVPWVGIRDATQNHGGVIYDTLQHTNALGIRNSAARLLPAHTVCLSRTASVGYVVVMGRSMSTSQDFVNWVCSEFLLWQFLKYILLAEGEGLLRFASGTTHQTIYFPEVKAFHICLPPIEEQRRVVGVLGALDDKINSNRRLAGLLEETAAAIVRRSASVAPSVVPLGDVAVFHNKQRIPLSAEQRRVRPGPFPYYGATGVIDHIDGFLFSGPHVLLGEDGSVQTDAGHPMVQYVWGDFWVNNHAHVLTFGDASVELGYVVLQTVNVAPFVTGAVQPKLSMRRLKEVLLSWPRERVALEPTIGELFALLRACADEARRLAGIRDALLPRLISGQIRVPDTADPAEVVDAAREALAAAS